MCTGTTGLQVRIITASTLSALPLGANRQNSVLCYPDTVIVCGTTEVCPDMTPGGERYGADASSVTQRRIYHTVAP